MVLPTNTIAGCSTLRRCLCPCPCPRPRPRPRLVRILPPARRRLSTPSRKYYCATTKRTHEEKEICLDFQSLTRTRKASFEIWCTLSHACGRDFLTHTNCAGDPHTHPRCSWGDAEALVRPSFGLSRSPPQAELPVCGSAAFQAGQGARMTRYLHVYMSASLHIYRLERLDCRSAHMASSLPAYNPSPTVSTTGVATRHKRHSDTMMEADPARLWSRDLLVVSLKRRVRLV